MSKKLFVGNLPFSFSEDKLYTMFAEHGSVSKANLITDKMTGQSRGFGFIEMNNDDEAQKAVEKLNGFSLDGRQIVVNEARPKKEFSGGDGRFGRGSDGGRRKGGFTKW